MSRSDSAARWCIWVMKQRSNCGHFCPVQASRRASTFFQSSLESGSQRNSARSPVSVRSSHFAQLRVLLHLLHAVQHRLLLHVVKLLPAEIILPPLHQRDAHLREQLLEKRNVFVEELLLKVLGSGGDDRAQAAAQQRHQVRQRLAGAGARFHNQVLAVFQRRLHALRHLELPRPEFVIRMVARQPSPGGKDFVEGSLVRLRVV